MADSEDGFSKCGDGGFVPASGRASSSSSGILGIIVQGIVFNVIKIFKLCGYGFRGET